MKLLIVIPTFHRARLLAACLNSIYSQINSNVHAVVMDQSLDDTSRLVCQQYSIIKHIHVDYQNKSRAINECIADSSEDIVTILDDDTVLNENWIKSVFQAFGNSTVDIVQGSIMVNGNLCADSISNNQDIITKKEIVGRRCMPPLFKIGCNFVFRKHVFDRVGRFNESLGPGSENNAGEDLEWGYRVFKKGYKLLLNPEMCISHLAWRNKEELEKQTEEYGRAFGEVLKLIRKECFMDFLAYFIYYWGIGYVKDLIYGNRGKWFEAALGKMF